MTEPHKPVLRGHRHRLAVQELVLAAIVVIPVVMYILAQAGDSGILLWGSIALMAAAMGVGIWTG